MANDLITVKNPFLRAADQLRAQGKIERSTIVEEPARRSTRARLNFIPDSETLAGMIDRALDALSRGRIWDRGAILNLVI